MSSVNFEQLEAELRTLGENKGILTTNKKQAIRDRVFQSIGQVELADAIATGEAKAGLAVSLKHLQQALIPHRLSFSMPVTAAVVMVVFLGSLVTGVAAQSSRPGDVLFAMKKVFQAIEIAAVADPIKKAEVSLNIAGERLQYLEESVGQEEALHIVLKESQSALVSAKETLKKAQESGDTANATALLDKFNSLLADQKVILEDIEKTTPSDDVKQTIVAIRDVIASDKEIESGKLTELSDKNATTTGSIVPKAITKPNNQPLTLNIALSGFQTLAGRISTAGGQPTIFFNGNQYVIIVSSPVSMDQYIGSSNVALSGVVKDGYFTVYRVVINGTVLADIIPQTTNPVSTDGNPENSNQSDQPVNQE
ncbi:MAG: hypothetical protein WC805_02995 [Patescibacteria group bacterium]|jgi:hypothetical protein